MKKRYLAAMIIGGAIMMTACGGSDSDSNATATPAPNKVVENSNDGAKELQDANTGDSNAKDDNASGEKDANDKSVAQIYAGLINAVQFEALFEAPEEYVANYFGIDTTTLEDSVFYIAESEISTETVIIVKTSEDNKDSVIASLNTYVESKKAELNNYLPEQYDIANKAEIKTKGDYVYLIMSANSDAANEYLDSNL